jgi:uncharacterized membrane protein
LVVLLVQQAVGVVIAGALIAATGDGLPGSKAVLLSLAAGAAGALALGAFYRALAVGTMSVVAPISASGVTLPVAVGIATGDRPSTVQAVGLVLTVVGVVLASREVHAGAPPAGARTSVVLALLAAVGFGSFFTLADGAAEDSVLWLLVISRTTAVVLLAGILAATGAGGAVARLAPRTVATLMLVGALDLAATGLFALASTEGELAVVAVVGSLYPVATVLLARLVLDEQLRGPQWAGVALAFAGVAAVAGVGA